MSLSPHPRPQPLHFIHCKFPLPLLYAGHPSQRSHSAGDSRLWPELAESYASSCLSTDFQDVPNKAIYTHSFPSQPGSPLCANDASRKRSHDMYYEPASPKRSHAADKNAPAILPGPQFALTDGLNHSGMTTEPSMSSAWDMEPPLSDMTNHEVPLMTYDSPTNHYHCDNTHATPSTDASQPSNHTCVFPCFPFFIMLFL